MKRTTTYVRLIIFCLVGAFSQSAFAQDTTLIEKESIWKYRDNGSDQGTAWRQVGFAASGWSTGDGPFGMGGITGATMNTTIKKKITTYFVKTLTLTHTNFSTLDFNVMYDDGFVLYINGKEVVRDNMPSGTITYTTLASTYMSGSDEGDYTTFSALDTFLVTGVNYFAFELHNNSASSSDLAFDLEVIAHPAIDSTDMVIFKEGAWKYKDDGSNQGTTWKDSSFNDAGWASGDAVLGYGTLDGATISTTVSYGASSSNKYITTYFRKQVTLSNPDYQFLELSLLADDGAAVYINGKLAMTYGMPASWSYTTTANYTVGGSEEGDYTIYQIPDTFLINGVNTFAVEVHQTNSSSSDLGFDLEVKGKTGRVVAGKIFLDMDGNGEESIYDVFGSGAIEIKTYNDADSNGVYTDTEEIKSILTNPYGDYSMIIEKNVRHVAVKMMTEDFDSDAEFTTDTTLTFTVNTANSDSVIANFGTLGPRSLCLLIADDQMNADQYYMANRITGKNQYISTMVTDEIEALAIRVGMDSMWAFDDGQFGSVDIQTGVFTPIGTGVGYGTGLINGSSAGHSFSDIDGLAYDAVNNILYGVERRNSGNDLLVTINRTTGDLIDGHFGSAREFVEIQGVGIKTDVDDIAFDPITGQLLAVNNQNSGDSTRYISIDPTTGVATVISIVGIGDFEGLGYYNTGELVGTTGADNKVGYEANSIYKINKETGVGTKLDTLYAGANDVEACDCLTGPTENLISGTVFYDADSSGTYNKNIDTSYGNIKIYLYSDANNNGVIDSGDVIVDSTLTNSTTGFYVFIVSSTGNFLTRPNIAFTSLETMNTTTNDSLTEAANFAMLGDFDGRNDFGFHLTSGQQYLPVAWLEIAAEWTENKNAAVTWSTASEVNASHYEVERRTDDGDFIYVGKVEANGTTDNISDYSFVDFEVSSIQTKKVFYKVKQVDFDEKFTYSDIVVLAKNEITEVKAYPNPITDYVNVTISQTGDYTLAVSDMAGNLVIEKKGINEHVNTPIRVGQLARLQRGMYILRITMNGVDHVTKLIK